MAKPKLDEIEKLLQKGKAFSLTDAQYEKKTGLRLPKASSYLKNKSALAKLCQKYGFIILIQEKQVTIMKGE